MAQKPAWWDAVVAEFARYGVPMAIWWPIMMAESGGDPSRANVVTNPTAGNRAEASYGLFQLNILGGQGQGYSAQQLLDPVTNARIAAQYIGSAYRKYGNDLAQVAIHSGHPGEVATSDSRVQRILTFGEQWARNGVAWVTGSGSGGGGGTNPLDIGAQVRQGVQAGLGGLLAGYGDYLRTHGAFFIFLSAGLLFVLLGLLGLALKTGVPQAAAAGAVTGGTGAAAVAGAKVGAARALRRGLR